MEQKNVAKIQIITWNNFTAITVFMGEVLYHVAG